MYPRSNPGRVLAGFVVAGLAACIFGELLTILVEMLKLPVLGRIEAGAQIPEETLATLDIATGLVALLQLLAFVTTAILFVCWLYRARANLDEAGVRGLEHSPGWAIGGWFVPFANLWFPYKVVEEVWIASDSFGKRFPAVSAPLVGWWWAAWILNGIVSWPVVRMMPDEGAPYGEWVTYGWASIVSASLGIAAGALAIAVVRGIDARQRAMFAAPPPMPELPRIEPGLAFS